MDAEAQPGMLYRLMQDPKRLFQRYWSTNLKFIWNATIRRK